MNTQTLYRIYDHTGTLLYVGITNDPGRRLADHRGNKPWWADIANVTMEHFSSRAELAAAERAAIRDEHPEHNIRHRTSDITTEAVPETPIEFDGLAGRWYHTWQDAAAGDERLYGYLDGRIAHWQGQVVDHVGDDSYLVQTYSWEDGHPSGGRRIIAYSDMLQWTFYDTAAAMQIALGCSETFTGEESVRRSGVDGNCRNPATHRTGLGNYVCWNHAKFYGDSHPIR